MPDKKSHTGSSKLKDKSVVQLRKLAKKHDVQQSRGGVTLKKEQLVRALAKKI